MWGRKVNNCPKCPDVSVDVNINKLDIARLELIKAELSEMVKDSPARGVNASFWITEAIVNLDYAISKLRNKNA